MHASNALFLALFTATDFICVFFVSWCQWHQQANTPILFDGAYNIYRNLLKLWTMMVYIVKCLILWGFYMWLFKHNFIIIIVLFFYRVALFTSQSSPLITKRLVLCVTNARKINIADVTDKIIQMHTRCVFVLKNIQK